MAGLLGMQAGAGQALSDIGKMGFQSALEEDRMKRVAEHKGSKTPNIQSFQQGGENVSGYFDAQGNFVEAGRGPKWNPNEGADNKQFSDAEKFFRSASEKSFGKMLGGQIILDDAAKEKTAVTADFATQIYNQMPADGKSMNKAFLMALAKAQKQGIMSMEEAEAAAKSAQLESMGPIDRMFNSPDEATVKKEGEKKYLQGIGLGQTQENVTTELPAQAMKSLQEGKITTFRNGQQWTIKNGKPVRIK